MIFPTWLLWVWVIAVTIYLVVSCGVLVVIFLDTVTELRIEWRGLHGRK